MRAEYPPASEGIKLIALQYVSSGTCIKQVSRSVHSGGLCSGLIWKPTWVWKPVAACLPEEIPYCCTYLNCGLGKMISVHASVLMDLSLNLGHGIFMSTRKRENLPELCRWASERRSWHRPSLWPKSSIPPRWPGPPGPSHRRSLVCPLPGCWRGCSPSEPPGRKKKYRFVELMEHINDKDK